MQRGPETVVRVRHRYTRYVRYMRYLQRGAEAIVRVPGGELVAKPEELGCAGRSREARSRENEHPVVADFAWGRRVTVCNGM